MPKILDLHPRKKNPLCCPICGEYRFIKKEAHQLEKDGKIIILDNFYYICKNCNTENDSILKDIFLNFKCFTKPILIKQKNNTYILQPERMKNYDSLLLKYDRLDYYGIPGLARPREDGYLTPVFFKKELLSYFNHHPDYKVKMFGRSIANIYRKNSNDREEITTRSIGINRNDNLFLFLGDLEDYIRHNNISTDELKIWKANNIESDHDIISDLYYQQLEVYFTIPDNERRIFEQIDEINQKTKKILGFNLFEYEKDKIENEYKYPIFNEKDQIARSVNLLCQFTIESINVTDIKNYLTKKSINIKNLKSTKLFERIIQEFSPDNLSNGLYILYDFEIIFGHKKSEEGHNKKLEKCFKRLGIKATSNYLEIFKAIINEIIENFNSIISEIK